MEFYLCTKYRGDNGDLATDEEIDENCRTALAIGDAIRRDFPDVEIYIPHEKQEIVRRLWRKGLIDSDDIIEVCCDIIKEECAGVIVVGTVSKGMLKEIVCTARWGLIIVEGDCYDDDLKENIADAIVGLQERNDFRK